MDQVGSLVATDGRGLAIKGHKGNIWTDGTAFYLNCGTQLDAFLKIHRNGHQKGEFYYRKISIKKRNIS